MRWCPKFWNVYSVTDVALRWHNFLPKQVQIWSCSHFHKLFNFWVENHEKLLVWHVDFSEVSLVNVEIFYSFGTRLDVTNVLVTGQFLLFEKFVFSSGKYKKLLTFSAKYNKFFSLSKKLVLSGGCENFFRLQDLLWVSIRNFLFGWKIGLSRWLWKVFAFDKFIIFW